MSGPFGSTTWMSNPSTEFYGHEITKSLRFDAPATPFLNFTPGSASNLRTWTWSGWLKKDTTKEFHTVFAATTELGAGNSHSYITYYLDDLYIQDYTASGNTKNYHFITDAKFRDPSAWKHVVFALDTTQATASNRAKLYVNGVQVTSFSTETYPAEDFDGKINSTLKHFIGNGFGSQPEGNNYAGYLADVNFIDGLQLGPSSFGELKNDIWISKDTSGLTFGTNGFRQQYKQTGTGTAGTSTIGADTSGETNHYTSNNLAAHDVLPDSPTNNFNVINPLFAGTVGEGNTSNGNLQFSIANTFTCHTSIGMPSGKWYFECIDLGNSMGIGIQDIDDNGRYTRSIYYTGTDLAGGQIYVNGSNNGSPGADWATGDKIGVALDMDAGTPTVQFFKNNADQVTVDLSDAGITVPNFSLVSGAGVTFTGVANFGQDSSFAGNKTAQGNADGNGIGDFYYAPPSGFLALCTANLPDPVAAIDPAKGGSVQDFFNPIVWAGTGSSNALDVGFQPDFSWIKRRNGTQSHNLHNSVNGATKYLISNTTAAEQTDSSILASFDANGITVGDNTWSNADGGTYVAWNWKAGTSFSNDASSTSVGTIDSAGSVSADTGFSIISYTGTGSNGTIAHGLGVAPEMLMVKNRSATDSWLVYHAKVASDAETDYLVLESTDDLADNATVWTDTAPTSSVFSIGTAVDVNTNTENYIAYCFASVEGYSKFGTYIGDASGNGPFIYTGFRPAFTMIKRINDDGESWIMQDSARSPDNRVVIESEANNAATEYSSDASTGYRITYMANGIKIKNTNVNWNAASGVYIYMAFAEQPFKYANAR